jgi:hypothetical protein
VKGKSDRIVVHAEDALIAALKVKSERPEAVIMYVRRLNRRGDTPASYAVHCQSLGQFFSFWNSMNHSLG